MSDLLQAAAQEVLTTKVEQSILGTTVSANISVYNQKNCSKSGVIIFKLSDNYSDSFLFEERQNKLTRSMH